MSLQDYRIDMERCCRCSSCKFVPLEKLVGDEFWNVCPSVTRYNFQAYAGGGKMNIGLALLDDRLEYTDQLLDIIYRCQLCGACDVSCKFNTDMEVLETLYEIRAQCIENGELIAEHMFAVDGLKREDNMLQKPKADRGKWAEGLDLKNIAEEKAEVYFHAGCRYCFDEELWPAVRASVELLKIAGIDFGIAGKEEACCGCRAYEMGYMGELGKYAEHNVGMLKTAGIKTVVTPCADCYYAFKVLYDKTGYKSDYKVFHITEFFDSLINDGRLELSKDVPLNVTYHDPCNLGRKGEPWIHWQGNTKTVLGHIIINDPPKQLRRGTYGIYEPPRNIIRSLPSVRLLEMDRNRESSWCCGSGGGVKEAYPEYSIWTARERIEEAKATGAEALITACPWCQRNFIDAMDESDGDFKVFDILELLKSAI